MLYRTDPATGEQIMILDAEGREVPDPNPMEVPLGMKRPPTLAEQVQRLVGRQLSDYAAMHGQETFAESEDFDVDEDEEPWSPHEVQLFNGIEATAADFQNPDRREAIKAAYLAAERTRAAAEDRMDQIDEAFRQAKKSGAGQRPAKTQKAAEPPPDSGDGPPSIAKT